MQEIQNYRIHKPNAKHKLQSKTHSDFVTYLHKFTDKIQATSRPVPTTIQALFALLFAVVAAAPAPPPPVSLTVDTLSVSDSRCEPDSSASPPFITRYLRAIASQSATFSMRVVVGCAKLIWEPSGDRCAMDRATESVGAYLD